MLGASGRVIRIKRNNLINTTISVSDPDAQTHINRLSNPTQTLADDINNLVVGLKADSVWTQFDDFCIFHEVGEPAWALYGVKGKIDSVTFGSPVFGANGYIFGAGAYANTGIRDNGSFNFSTNSQTLMVNIKDVVGDGTDYLMGGSETTLEASQMDGFGGGSTIAEYLMATSGDNLNFGVGDDPGFWMASRSTSTRSDFFINASAVNATTATDRQGSQTNNITVGALNIGGVPTTTPGSPIGTISAQCWGVGGGYTLTEMNLVKARFETYLAARGL